MKSLISMTRRSVFWSYTYDATSADHGTGGALAGRYSISLPSF